MMNDFKLSESINSFLSGNSSEAASSDQPISENPNLIPPFVRDICKEPKSVEMRVTYDAPTLQSTYTYSITWDDDDDKEKSEKIYQQVMRKSESATDTEKSRRLKLKEETKMSCNELLSAPTATATVDDITAADSTSGVTPVSAVCDGPCKKSFPSNMLNTIGRCGHYLCAACYGIVKNSDGTNGCSALHCNWKGVNRKEAKLYFEKEVCRKQRARAREMKSRGFDVKPASSRSHSVSEKTSRENSQNSKKSIKQTNCSISPHCGKSSKFQLVYPSDQELIGVKLLILEPLEIMGTVHYSSSVTELEIESDTRINKVVTALLLQRYGKLPRQHFGVLYIVELQSNWTRRVRRVRKKEFANLSLFHFPQVAEYVVFVLDFGDFIKEGQEINFE